MKYIKSPINYIGNKYKILSSIITLFPKEIDTFVDIFGGSGTVLINTVAKKYIYNDNNNYVASIFNGLINEDIDYILGNIYSIINTYSLSKINRDGFEKLRNDYNNGMNDWITLYVLMCYSFNHQFRFNNKHQYNSSFGRNRSYFSERQKEDLLKMRKKFKSNVDITIKNFIDIDYSKFTKNDLIYFDPPYLNSVGSYNDGKRGFDSWNNENEVNLLNLLDKLNNTNIRFALSNNLKYNNEHLKKWINKYNIHYLDLDYSNCNYHKKDKTSKDDEVLITNY